jgi:type VI secretion system ImpM family protein
MDRSSPAPAVALFGKLPSALDFVRVNHSSAESIVLDRWLHAALQRLASRNRPWPSGELAFAFGTDADHGLVGVIADSRDRAGRRFPVAVYAQVPRPPRGGSGTAALVLASEPFVFGARALLARRDELTPAEVMPRLRRLRPPRASDVEDAAEQLARTLVASSLGDFARRLFAAAPAPELCARAALEQLRPRSSGAGEPCFDCPVQSAGDVAIWAYGLESVRGRQSSALWDLSAPGRALLGAGPLPERAALFWGQPTLSHPQLCRIGEVAAPKGAAADGVGGSLAAAFEQLAGEPAPAAAPTR